MLHKNKACVILPTNTHYRETLMLKSIHPFFIAKNVMMMDRFFPSYDSATLFTVAHTFLKGVYFLSCRRCAAVENYGVTLTRAILRLY